jgi:hypothetical protein
MGGGLRGFRLSSWSDGGGTELVLGDRSQSDGEKRPCMGSSQSDGEGAGSTFRG